MGFLKRTKLSLSDGYGCATENTCKGGKVKAPGSKGIKGLTTWEEGSLREGRGMRGEKTNSGALDE